MIIRKSATRTFPIPECHGGAGALLCREVLGDYEKASPGFKYIHEDTLEPGVSIGLHTHRGDEEIYVILEGEGTMQVDGETLAVAAGDVCLTRDGHSHSLANTGTRTMRLLVACAGLGWPREETDYNAG